jgi:hypothetical protein
MPFFVCQLYNNVVRSSCYANSAARVEENERGVHYVFNPGCYFRMINAKPSRVVLPLFAFFELMLEVIARFGDNGRIVDHGCLNLVMC